MMLKSFWYLFKILLFSSIQRFLPSLICKIIEGSSKIGFADVRSAKGAFLKY